MKTSIVASALALTTAFAAPVTEVASDNSNDAAQPQFLVSRFDSAVGDGWLFSPPGSSKNAMLKFYKNDSLMSGRKGSAWVLEFQEDVDAKQVAALTNMRNAFNERPVARPLAPNQPYTLPQRQAGAGVGGGSAGTFRPNPANIVPAGQATPARPAAPAVLAAPAVPAAPAALVPAAQLAPAAPVAQQAPAQLLQAPQQVVPAALLAPAAQLSTLQGGPTITGLITQAGQLIGQQIGVSIGNVIGSTLEGVVQNYFPPPKNAGGQGA